MARPVYSVQILSAAPLLLSNTIECPDGVKLVLRDWAICELSGTNGSILVLNSPSGAAALIWQRTASTPLGAFHQETRMVLNPGEFCTWNIIGGSWSVWVSGYELTLT